MTMMFMCEKHKNALSQHSADSLYGYFQSWLDEGYAYYELKDFSSALKYFGNARDIAHIKCLQQNMSAFDITDLLVSSILVTDTLFRLEQKQKMEFMLANTFQFLGHHLHSYDNKISIREAMTTLLDHNAHADYMKLHSSFELLPHEEDRQPKLWAVQQNSA